MAALILAFFLAAPSIAAAKRLPHITSSIFETKQGLIGRIKVRMLNTGDDAFDLRNEAISLANHGINGLILDLRDATGDDAEVAYEAAGPFLRGGRVVFELQHLDLDYVPDYCWVGSFEPNYCYWDGPAVMFNDTIPIVIVINEETSGVPEAVAGALQAHRRAIIVGARSKGKGILTVTRGKRVTRYRIKLTDGRTYDEIGLSPNLEINQATPGKKAIMVEAMRKLMEIVAKELAEIEAEEEARKRLRPHALTPSVN